MSRTRASVIGATGYAGAELLRILLRHPRVSVAHITSESSAGKRIDALYPHLRGLCDLALESLADLERIGADSDVVFIALPAGHAMDIAKRLAAMPARIVDLGGDFRFDDVSVYERWYKAKHTYPEAERVYGLCELTRARVRTAKIVANAGCYTTASILALAPAVKHRLVALDTLIVDAASGVSGAGRSAKVANLLPELHDNFKAYGVASHKHTPEIEQALGELAGTPIALNFTPHLVPMSRGILSTCYAKLRDGVGAEDVDAAYNDMYGEEPFVRLLGLGGYPQPKQVRGSNFCDLGWHVDARTHRLIVLSAIDNLVKGAAGHAVQNMNVMFGYDERTGLELVPLYP